MNGNNQTELPQVLVVDDCALTRNVVLMLLGHDGLSGIAVASLTEACHMLERQHFDLVISDFSLSEHETGFEVFAEIKRLPRVDQPAFIMMSGWRREELDPEALYLSDVPFISKPFDVVGFRHAIAAVQFSFGLH